MRLSEIDQEIMTLKEELNEKKRLLHKLEDAEKELNQQTQAAEQAKMKLNKEQQDVEKLEKLSFSSLWFGLLGSKREKLTKETEERDQALYQYKRHQEQIEPLRLELTRLKSKINELSRKESMHRRLLEEKEALILTSDHELRSKLEEINQQILFHESNMKELNEAIHAGNALLKGLSNVYNSLNSAKNWGTWDMFGGGFISNMAKHSKLDEAQAGINQLEYQANHFKRELKDVHLTINISIDIDSTMRFFDYFFDGFIMDYTVQNKINKAIQNVMAEDKKVKTVIMQLENQRKVSRNKIEQLKAEKSRLLGTN